MAGISSKTVHVGFRCPVDLYNRVLANTADKSKFINGCLTGVERAVEHPAGTADLVALDFMKMFNTLSDRDPELARSLFNTLNEKAQVRLLEFLESNKE